MMKKIAGPVAAVLAAVMLTSCRVVDGGERGFRDAPKEERELLFKDSKRLGDGILKAFRDKDFAALKRNMPGELGTQLAEKDFAASCRNCDEKFGKLREFRLLTSLETPAFGNLIWVVTFARHGADGAEIRRQLLFRLVTMRVDGRTQVVSCGFL